MTEIEKFEGVKPPVIRSGADFATAKALWKIWSGFSWMVANGFIYLLVVPVMFVALIVALPYIVLSKLTGLDLIDR